MKPTLSETELQLLAEAERMMDDGRLAFVMLDGQRLSVSAEAIEHFKLKHGQTINPVIFTAILQFNIASLTTRIGIDKTREPFRR